MSISNSKADEQMSRLQIFEKTKKMPLGGLNSDKIKDLMKNRLKQKIIEEQIKAIFNMKDNAFDYSNDKQIDEEEQESIKEKKKYEEELNSIREAEFQIKKIIDIKFKECIISKTNPAAQIINDDKDTNINPFIVQANNSNKFKNYNDILNRFTIGKLENHEILGTGIGPEILIKAFYKTLDCFIRMQKERFFEENYNNQILFDKFTYCINEKSIDLKFNKLKDLFNSEINTLNELFRVLLLKLEAYIEASSFLNSYFAFEISLMSDRFKINFDFKIFILKLFIQHYITRNPIIHVIVREVYEFSCFFNGFFNFDQVFCLAEIFKENFNFIEHYSNNPENSKSMANEEEDLNISNQVANNDFIWEKSLENKLKIIEKKDLNDLSLLENNHADSSLKAEIDNDIDEGEEIPILSQLIMKDEMFPIEDKVSSNHPSFSKNFIKEAFGIHNQAKENRQNNVKTLTGRNGLKVYIDDNSTKNYRQLYRSKISKKHSDEKNFQPEENLSDNSVNIKTIYKILIERSNKRLTGEKCINTSCSGKFNSFNPCDLNAENVISHQVFNNPFISSSSKPMDIQNGNDMLSSYLPSGNSQPSLKNKEPINNKTKELLLSLSKADKEDEKIVSKDINELLDFINSDLPLQSKDDPTGAKKKKKNKKKKEKDFVTSADFMTTAASLKENQNGNKKKNEVSQFNTVEKASPEDDKTVDQFKISLLNNSVHASFVHKIKIILTNINLLK